MLRFVLLPTRFNKLELYYQFKEIWGDLSTIISTAIYLEGNSSHSVNSIGYCPNVEKYFFAYLLEEHILFKITVTTIKILILIKINYFALFSQSTKNILILWLHCFNLKGAFNSSMAM